MTTPTESRCSECKRPLPANPEADALIRLIYGDLPRICSDCLEDDDDSQ